MRSRENDFQEGQILFGGLDSNPKRVPINQQMPAAGLPTSLDILCPGSHDKGKCSFVSKMFSEGRKMKPPLSCGLYRQLTQTWSMLPTVHGGQTPSTGLLRLSSNHWHRDFRHTSRKTLSS